jgi:hypothetical protein
MKNKIKSFYEFNEAISGTLDISPYGPGFPRPEFPATIGRSSTTVLFSEITQELYTEQDYQSLYQDYLKKGGKPLHGFNKENLDIVLSEL